MEEKTTGQLLSEKLTYKSKNSFAGIDSEAVHSYCEGYKAFLDAGKTEREVVKETIAMISAQGYVPYTLGDKLVPGGKYYLNNRNKSLFMFRIGSEPIEEGIRITASHIDSPRVDFKPRPVYEDSEMCFFKTHYYGGIKKYQWTAIPLSLHGVICKKDGDVDVRIGDDESEPVFYINDLPPHLAQTQYEKTVGKAISGEQLNVLAGSQPYDDDKVSDKVKLQVLAALNEKYGCTEADLISAELCAVPAMKARDVGFDRSMIGSYGHDDRVCAYPSVTAMLESEDSAHTLLNIIADKEEVGSDGVSGMQCKLLADLIEEIALNLGGNPRVVRAHSKCLSADVNVAYDPNFPDVFEKRNSAMINHGVVLSKYTGSRGKSGTSDASAEFVSFVTKIFDDADVNWQMAELGKVDQGGGGTVAKFIASNNIDVIDLGVPVLSMHAPYEVVAKNDVYMTHKAIAAFYR
ncbi:MAG: aminopeptidase [Clostridia bacterium]|nr:aminopeptidase [Clostridia bacterium]